MGEGNRLQKGKCQGLPAYPGPDLLPLHAPLDLRLDLRQELLLLTMDAKGRCEDSSGDGCHCGGHRFHPWSEKISHATEQLSPSTTTTDAHVPSSLCFAAREAATVRRLSTAARELPHSAQLENPVCTQR